MLTGGCLCGVIRYQTDGAPFHESICHCSLCRRSCGAPYVAWFSVPRPSLVFTSGRPAWYRSSASGERAFCARCGTSLLFRSSEFPAEIDVTTASLDHPELLPPRDQLYMADRIEWIETVPHLHGFPAART